MEIKYDTIGAGYNSTRQADPYLTERILALLQPKNDGVYLDIGCGTGNYTIALAARGLRLVGVEPSAKMLDVARSRNSTISWQNGTAEQIPAGDKAFDGIIATLTIHHWTNLQKAFAELSRVLADDGRMILFTSTPAQMQGYWLNHYFPQMLRSSIVQMPSLDAIATAAGVAGLRIIDSEKYVVKDDLKDCFLYAGKNNPELYFNESIRNGISSFSSLANSEEVKEGLMKLRNDIDSQAFDAVRTRYENEWGDYLFVVIEKAGV